MIDVSHLITFVAGTAVGAAGQYMADRFTDQRRKREAKQDATAKFQRAIAASPTVLAELKTGLIEPDNAHVRELVALSGRGVTFNGDRRRFLIYESEHTDLTNQIAFLVELGYLKNVSSTSTPIYQLSEEFRTRLKSDA